MEINIMINQEMPHGISDYSVLNEWLSTFLAFLETHTQRDKLPEDYDHFTVSKNPFIRVGKIEKKGGPHVRILYSYNQFNAYQKDATRMVILDVIDTSDKRVHNSYDKSFRDFCKEIHADNLRKIHCDETSTVEAFKWSNMSKIKCFISKAKLTYIEKNDSVTERRSNAVILGTPIKRIPNLFISDDAAAILFEQNIKTAADLLKANDAISSFGIDDDTIESLNINNEMAQIGWIPVSPSYFSHQENEINNKEITNNLIEKINAGTGFSEMETALLVDSVNLLNRELIKRITDRSVDIKSRDEKISKLEADLHAKELEIKDLKATLEEKEEKLKKIYTLIG